MEKRISNNFSEFLQDTSSSYSKKEKQEIYDLVKEELDGILKQIKMFIKTFNSTIEFDELKNKFYSILENSYSSIDDLVKNIYNISYQEVFSKIIRDGDYALKSNRYQASTERINLLETTISNHLKNIEDSKIIIKDKINDQNSNFVNMSIIDNLLTYLDEVFFIIPCKQNDSAYKESCDLLARTKNVIIEQLNDVCANNIELLNKEVTSYLEDKVRYEKGFTSNKNFTISELLEAKAAALETKPAEKQKPKRGRKKKTVKAA